MTRVCETRPAATCALCVELRPASSILTLFMHTRACMRSGHDASEPFHLCAAYTASLSDWTVCGGPERRQRTHTAECMYVHTYMGWTQAGNTDRLLWACTTAWDAVWPTMTGSLRSTSVFIVYSICMTYYVFTRHAYQTPGTVQDVVSKRPLAFQDEWTSPQSTIS